MAGIGASTKYLVVRTYIITTFISGNIYEILRAYISKLEWIKISHVKRYGSYTTFRHLKLDLLVLNYSMRIVIRVRYSWPNLSCFKRIIRNVSRCRKILTLRSSTATSIIRLPREIRIEIFKRLTGKNEVLPLRLVCKKLCSDIDHGVGIHATIDSRAPNCQQWYKGVVITSCTILHSDQELDIFNIVRLPSLVRRLKFRGISNMRLYKLHLVLHRFINVRRLDIEILNHKTFSTDEYLNLIFSALESMSSLNQLKISIAPKNLHLPTILKSFHSPSWRRIPVFRNLSFLYLNVPDITEAALPLVQNLMEQQRNLKSFHGNVGRIVWDFYLPLLIKNCKSLQKVSVENVQTWDSNNRKSIPFDFTCFSNMKNLQQLIVNASPLNDNPMSISWVWKFESLPVDTIVELYLNNIFITASQIEHIAKMSRLRAFRCFNGGPTIRHNVQNVRKTLNRIRRRMNPHNFFVYDFKPTSSTQTENDSFSWKCLVTIINDAIIVIVTVTTFYFFCFISSTDGLYLKLFQ